MSRPIDADILLNKAWDADNGFGWEKVVSIKDVMDAPTIDAVPVVRCRYCECWYPEENDVWGHCRRHDFWSSETWFCADGERKGE